MSNIVLLIVGIVVGVVVAGIVGVQVMRSKMVVTDKSAYTFEETCARLESVVGDAEGWSFPNESFDMGAKLTEKGALPDNLKRIKQYYVCNPKIAKKVLGDSPHLSAIMPCTWAVYEKADGSVWVSKMNIPMMSKMMGGVVGEAMGVVAEAEEGFAAQVLN
jgi:uncharacterized protein (DUF302 family)